MQTWKSLKKFQELVLYFRPKIGLKNVKLTQWWSNGGSSVELNCKLVLTKGLRNVRCLFWVEIGIRWEFNPRNITVSSKFSSVEVWVNLVNFRLWVKAEYGRFFYSVGRMDLIPLSCLGWLNIWLSSLSE